MLRARSSYECRLYLELHPHECGETAFPSRSSIVRGPDGLMAVYAGTCPRCGKARTVEFVLAEEMPPQGISFGGDTPSAIIDPGEFIAAADRAASRAPATLDGLTPERAQAARDQLALAAAAIEEVLKFIPPGEDRVPVGAFTSSAGKQVYLREPGRFDRARLEAVLASYRDGYDAEQRAADRAAIRERGTEVASAILDALDAPEDPAAKLATEEHERRNAELLEVYYVRSKQRPPTARSVAEMQLATELEPCAQCAARELRDVVVRGEGTAWTLTASCATCGTPRSKAFTTTGDPRVALHGDHDLGAGPSLQLRAEALRDELARVLPSAGTDAAAWRRAIVLVNELAKLTRPGPDFDALQAQHAELIAKGAEMGPFARVLASPGSIAARKALLAAWKARKDPRAELLEQQLAYLVHQQQDTTGTPAADALMRSINVAVGRNGKAWAGELSSLVDDLRYHRGLVAEVTLPGAVFVARAPRLFALAPIQHVTLTAPLGPVAALFASPYLAKLTSLNIPQVGAQFGDAGAIALAKSPHASNLRWISLPDDAITEAGVEALAASPYLQRVRYLGLRGNAADPTPYVHDADGVYTSGRPALAAELERTYGARPWLAEPSEPADWPPNRDALAITP